MGYQSTNVGLYTTYTWAILGLWIPLCHFIEAILQVVLGPVFHLLSTVRISKVGIQYSVYMHARINQEQAVCPLCRGVHLHYGRSY